MKIRIIRYIYIYARCPNTDTFKESYYPQIFCLELRICLFMLLLHTVGKWVMSIYEWTKNAVPWSYLKIICYALSIYIIYLSVYMYFCQHVYLSISHIKSEFRFSQGTWSMGLVYHGFIRFLYLCTFWPCIILFSSWNYISVWEYAFEHTHLLKGTVFVNVI